ncbi:hypothetical protein N7476_007160 [Penicillium atrosanguineum]|uniref:Uncharacterized protein n=2 Tax=Penicillium atrosanguineum TaxID=1132637 RepID=A0A9W9PTZ8_9EURO|nr:hypothetical protein N7476_007160 [Penicillium atrosanguineum]
MRRAVAPVGAVVDTEAGGEEEDAAEADGEAAAVEVDGVEVVEVEDGKYEGVDALRDSGWWCEVAFEVVVT